VTLQRGPGSRPGCADDFAPAYVLIAAALVQLAAFLGLKETAGKPLA
jgi:hypothetical protein